MTLFLAPRLPLFLERYPNIKIEVSVEGRFVDAVAEGFDLGIRCGGTVPEGMIAARLSPQLDCVVVGAPTYFALYGRPRKPMDLMQHRCIRVRTGNGRILAWELGEGPSMQSIDVPGDLTLGDTELSLAMARAGVGLFYYLRKKGAGGYRRGQTRGHTRGVVFSGRRFFCVLRVQKTNPSSPAAFPRSSPDEVILARKPAIR